MPDTLAARPDLAALVAHYRDLLGLRDWAITAQWVPAENWTTPALAQVTPLPERRIAHIDVNASCPAEDLRATIAHELVHALLSPLTAVGEWSGGALMLEEQVVESLAVAITRAEALPAEAAVMRRALADLPSRLRARLAARPHVTRSRMDAVKVLEAIKSQDGDAALALLDAYLVELVKGAMGDAGVPVEDAAPQEGEGAAAMMRRVLKAALARKAPAATLVDTGFTAKVLQRLGAKTEGEALLRIAALKVADSQVEDLAVADDMLQRKAAATATMKRTNIPRPVFFVDGKDELQPEWLEGTLEEVERTFGAMKRGGRSLARPRVEPDLAAPGGVEIPEAVRKHAERRGRGNDVKYMQRLAREMHNGGTLPQES